jgi:hypothetical protein
MSIESTIPTTDKAIERASWLERAPEPNLLFFPSAAIVHEEEGCQRFALR